MSLLLEIEYWSVLVIQVERNISSELWFIVGFIETTGWLSLELENVESHGYRFVHTWDDNVFSLVRIYVLPLYIPVLETKLCCLSRNFDCVSGLCKLATVRGASLLVKSAYDEFREGDIALGR